MEKEIEIKENNTYTFQRGYVIYYENPRLLKRIKKMPLKVTYISKRQKAIYCYTDYRMEGKLIGQLKNNRLKFYLEKAPLFDEKLNF